MWNVVLYRSFSFNLPSFATLRKWNEKKTDICLEPWRLPALDWRACVPENTK